MTVTPRDFSAPTFLPVPTSPHLATWAVWLACLVSVASAGDVQLLQRRPDPYGYPRPSAGETNVPTGTSLFLQLGFQDQNTTDTVDPDSVTVRIGPAGGPAADVLLLGKRFADGYSGKVFPSGNPRQAIAVYIDSRAELQPATTYAVTVSARSKQGGVLPAEKGSWQFTTAAAAKVTHALRFPLDLSAVARPLARRLLHRVLQAEFLYQRRQPYPGLRVDGPRPANCGGNHIPGRWAENDSRPTVPVPTKAWSLQRDFWLTGMEHQPGFLAGDCPTWSGNAKRAASRRPEKHADGILLRVEDFFGHAQYGIASDRPLADDYHPGDEVLIADGVSHARAKVVAVVDDATESRSLLVTSFTEPPAAGRSPTPGRCPKRKTPHAPGLFPPGGCYLRKFRPPARRITIGAGSTRNGISPTAASAAGWWSILPTRRATCRSTAATGPTRRTTPSITRSSAPSPAT